MIEPEECPHCKKEIHPKGWQNDDVSVPNRILVQHLPKYIKYEDQYGCIHEAKGYINRTEVKIIKAKSKRNWSQGAPYPTSIDVRYEAVDEQDNKFILSFNNWGDSMGTEHSWYHEVTGETYYELRNKYGSLPMVEITKEQK